MFLSVIFLTLSANIDCLLLGISYSIRHIRISFQQNILIAFLTTSGTFLAMKLGHYLLLFISLQDANHIGALFMIAIGIFMFYQKEKEPKTLFEFKYYHLSWKETLLLGITLSLNNMGLCLGASITGLPYLPTCLFTFLTSILFIALSQALRYATFFNRIQKIAPILAKLMILLLGLYEFIV